MLDGIKYSIIGLVIFAASLVSAGFGAFIVGGMFMAVVGWVRERKIESVMAVAWTALMGCMLGMGVFGIYAVVRTLVDVLAR